MVNIVEKTFDIRFDNMAHRLKHYQVIEFLQCLMTVSFWTKAIRAVHKVLLVYALKYPRDTTFYYLVLQCGYS